MIYFFWLAYGTMAIVIGPMRTWSVILAIVLWYQANRMPQACLRSVGYCQVSSDFLEFQLIVLYFLWNTGAQQRYGIQEIQQLTTWITRATRRNLVVVNNNENGSSNDQVIFSYKSGSWTIINFTHLREIIGWFRFLVKFTLLWILNSFNLLTYNELTLIVPNTNVFHRSCSNNWLTMTWFF